MRGNCNQFLSSLSGTGLDVAGANTRRSWSKPESSFWVTGWKKWPPALSGSTEHLHSCATVLSNSRTTTQQRILVEMTPENGAPNLFVPSVGVDYQLSDGMGTVVIILRCRELWDEYFRFDLELDYDAPPNMIDGRAVEKGWRRRQAEALETEVREEHPELSDEEVAIECERRS